MMILAVVASVVVAATEPPPANSSPAGQFDKSLFSRCVLNRIADLEHTSPDKLDRFSKKNADDAMRSCQSAKAEWASNLDRMFQADPNLTNSGARKAKISEVISSDELAVMLMVTMKAK